VLIIGCGLLVASAGVTAATRDTSAFTSRTVAVLGLGIVGAGLGLIVGGWLARRAAVVPADWPDAQYAVEVRMPLGARAIVAVAPTTLARAVDFSDDRREGRERSWRTFVFARQSYAREFSRLNARCLFERPPISPGSRARPTVLRARALYYVAGAALTAAVMWSVLGR